MMTMAERLELRRLKEENRLLKENGNGRSQTMTIRKGSKPGIFCIFNLPSGRSASYAAEDWYAIFDMEEPLVNFIRKG